MLITSAITGITTVLLSLSLAFSHLIHYTTPSHQRQLIRALVVPASFAFFCFLAIAAPSAAEYLLPLAELYECFALVALFLFIIYTVAPDRQGRLAALAVLGEGERGKALKGGWVKWLARRWLLIYQVLPVHIITMLAQWICVATLCHTGSKYDNALTALSVVNGASALVCIVNMVKVVRRLKPELAGHRVMGKVVAVKAIVALQVTQNIVFTVLSSEDVIHATDVVSQEDWDHSIPNFIISCEMVFFAGLFLWLFSPTGYMNKEQSMAKLSVGRALVDVFNVSDIVREAFYVRTIRNRSKEATQFSDFGFQGNGYFLNQDGQPPSYEMANR